jgi:hypothetical protein
MKVRRQIDSAILSNERKQTVRYQPDTLAESLRPLA